MLIGMVILACHSFEKMESDSAPGKTVTQMFLLFNLMQLYWCLHHVLESHVKNALMVSKLDFCTDISSEVVLSVPIILLNIFILMLTRLAVCDQNYILSITCNVLYWYF